MSLRYFSIIEMQIRTILQTTGPSDIRQCEWWAISATAPLKDREKAEEFRRTLLSGLQEACANEQSTSKAFDALARIKEQLRAQASCSPAGSIAKSS
jgi:hypothetical protein